MTDKRRRDAIGGEVDAALADLAHIDEARHMSKRDRERLEKQLERVDAHYDVPRAVKDAIGELGEKLGTSASAVARVLLAYGLHQYQEGEIDFYKVRKNPSVSPKYDYQIEDEEILAILSGKRQLESTS
ncbi:MAG: hypothetical protein U9R72_12225 [Chloroflexota bacterium]|nr:hypothetical protein [Chloroflexota bacterium]